MTDSFEQFSAQIRHQGAGFQIGPFRVRLRVRVRRALPVLHRVYSRYPAVGTDNVFGFHPCLDPVRRSLRAPFERRVRFSVDGRAPHEDMPESQSLAVLEWGLNLAIALRCQTYLMLHSAVVARGEYALIMPAAPGDGKSTLCAALVLRGWRLLSDEFGLLLPGQTRVVPIPRPIPLKGQSIDIIQSESQSAEFGPVIEGTKKGTVRHLLPPPQSIVSQDVTAEARWIVFPKWSADAETRVTELRGIEAFMRIAGNSFNYEVLGEPAFQSVTALVRTCRCYELEYSNLDSAISVLGQLG